MICISRERCGLLLRKTRFQAFEYHFTGEPGNHRAINPGSLPFGGLQSDIHDDTLIAALEQEQTVVLCSLKDKEIEIRKIGRNSQEELTEAV